MINFNDVYVHRLIIHNIIEKQPGQITAHVDPADDVYQVEDDVLELIRKRLRDSAGRRSKAFELEISKTGEDSFFQMAYNLSTLENNDFIAATTDIAEFLASCQKRTNIGTAYLLVMDCYNSEDNEPLVIVIKAEPHEALRIVNTSGRAQLDVLNEVFLSPSQKLYKIGILYKKPDGTYGAFLFDDQFNPADGHPAEYFYKEFLGLSADNNGKIQTQKFYDTTESFIRRNVHDIGEIARLLSSLKNEMVNSLLPLINPRTFAETYLHGDLKSLYFSEVCSELPGSILKDTVMIDNKIKRRKMNFNRNINVNGPEEFFDSHVEVIESTNRLSELSPDNDGYTIVKILGKPYKEDEQ